MTPFRFAVRPDHLGLWGLLAAAALMTACSDVNETPQCPAGEVFHQGSCAPLCNSDSDCSTRVCELQYGVCLTNLSAIDECRRGVSDCHSDAACTDLPEGYACECNPGFRGDGKTCTAVGLFDDDGDGVRNADDRCAEGSSGWTSDATSDRDADGCQDDGEDLDDDNDGVGDAADKCKIGVLDWTSSEVTDHDGDGCADNLEDPDDDNDGVQDGPDQCPSGEIDWIASPTTDYDFDGCRDETEDPDDDNDMISDALDTCAKGERGWFSNESTDYDNDGCQDNVEDPDDDNDGIDDGDDGCPRGKLDWANTDSDIDGDGCRDSDEDLDDDGDNIKDAQDDCPEQLGSNEAVDTEATRDGCADLLINMALDACSLVNAGFLDDGSRSGAIESTTGYDGTRDHACKFKGGSISVPFDPELQTESFSTGGWVRQDASGNNREFHGIFGWRGTGVSGYNLFIVEQRAGNGSMNNRIETYFAPLEKRPSGNPWNLVTAPSVDTGKWQHVLNTYDAATETLKLYVNGCEVSALTTTYDTNHSQSFVIGSVNRSAYRATAGVQEVRTYNRVLSGGEIRELAGVETCP